MSPRFSLPFLLLALGAGSAARADVIVTQHTVEAGKAVSRSPETLTLASDDALWSESWGGDFGPEGASYRRTIQITRYAPKHVITMDVALKIYKVEPIEPEFLPGTPLPKFRLTHLQDEKILGYNTHHFYLDMMFDKSPFANGGTLVRQELWVLPAASDPNLPSQPRNFRAIESLKISGDTQFLPEIQSGIIIRKSLFDSVAPEATPSKVVYIEEVSALTIGDLPADTFAIPPGYRELSPTEYAAAIGKSFGEELERRMEKAHRRKNAT